METIGKDCLKCLAGDRNAWRYLDRVVHLPLSVLVPHLHNHERNADPCAHLNTIISNIKYNHLQLNDCYAPDNVNDNDEVNRLSRPGIAPSDWTDALGSA